jgi:hypothetical protein
MFMYNTHSAILNYNLSQTVTNLGLTVKFLNYFCASIGKVIPVHVMKAYRKSAGIALLIPKTWHQVKIQGQSETCGHPRQGNTSMPQAH